MKKLIFLNLLFIISANCNPPEIHNPPLQTSHDLKNLISTSDNQPTENLKKVFEILNIENDGTFADIEKKAEKLLHYQNSDHNYFDAYKNKNTELRPIFEELGMINPIEGITKKTYKYAIIAPGYVGVTFCRLNFLKQFWNQGTRFEKIIILTGQRNLIENDWESNSVINIDKNLKCKTKNDLIKNLFDQFDMPKEMKKLPVVFVNTPKQKTEDDKLQDPMVNDQVKYWFDSNNPEPGDCLAIINQPYVRTFENILRNILPETFETIDSIGYAVHEKYESVNLWLEALIWWLYSEQQLLLN